MFSVSFGELIVIGIVALCVIRPERLPHVAKLCGRFALRAKQYYLSIKNEFSEEFRTNKDSSEK